MFIYYSQSFQLVLIGTPGFSGPLLFALEKGLQQVCKCLIGWERLIYLEIRSGCGHGNRCQDGNFSSSTMIFCGKIADKQGFPMQSRSFKDKEGASIWLPVRFYFADCIMSSVFVNCTMILQGVKYRYLTVPFIFTQEIVLSIPHSFAISGFKTNKSIY